MVFKQCNELNRKMKLLSWKIRKMRKKKQKKAKITVKDCEELS